MAISGGLISLAVFICLWAMLALGLNIKFGYNGLLDIGHVAFYLVGAYMTALLVLPPDSAPTQQFATYILGLQWTWPIAIAVGIVAAGLFGMLVALPAIRLREDYLAIAVLGISVIAKRTIQTETWLANGPTSLKGWNAPMDNLFPMPGPESGLDVIFLGIGVIDVTLFTVPAEIVFGLIVFGAWAIITAAIAHVHEGITDEGMDTLDWALAVTTLGVGYRVAKAARDDDGTVDLRTAAIAGGAFGVVGTALAFVGDSLVVVTPGVLLGTSGTVSLGMWGFAVYLFMGFASLAAWVLGATLLYNHYDELPRDDAIKGIAIGVAFVCTFIPLVLLGAGGDDRMASIGVFGTFALLVGVMVGIYRLGDRWDEYGSGGAFVSIIGVAAATLFALRYFVLSAIQPTLDDGVAGLVSTTVENLLWLVNFSGGTPGLNYRRFFFLLMVVLLAAVYLLTERTVKSPFGRVLKAIREDEDVATALGKNVFRYKVQSMILGSAIAGLAGGLAAIYFGTLVHTMFAPRVTFIALLMVVIGGTANNRGAILGAVIYWGFQQATTDLKAFFPTDMSSKIAALRLAFIGALFMIILYYRPQGIWGEERVQMEEIE